MPPTYTMPTWKPRIGIGLEASWGSGVVAGASIPANGPKGLATTNMPDLNPNVEFIKSPKQHGQPTTIMRGGAGVTELQVGPKVAGTTLEGDVSPSNIIPMLLSLFQGQIEGAASPYDKIFTNYTRATDLDFLGKSVAVTTPYLLSIIKDLSISAPEQVGESMRLISAVCRSLALSGTRGEPVKYSAEFIAKELEIDYTAAGAFDLASTSGTPLLFQDTTFTWADVESNINVAFVSNPLIGFSLNFTNNLEHAHYDSQNIGNLIPGRFEVTGSITVPWRNNDFIDKFLTTQPLGFKFSWGTVGVLGGLEIYIVAVFNGESSGGDAEVELEMPFEGVAYYDPTVTEAAPEVDAMARIAVSDGLDWALTQ